MKEKAPADGSTSTRAMEKSSETNRPLSEIDYNPERVNSQFLIASVLKCGADNAISKETLMKYLGYQTKRELWHEIERERAAGAVILTQPGSRGGYFLPNTDAALALQECEAFIALNRKKAVKAMSNIKSVKDFMRHLKHCMSGQQEIEECGE